jgi:predicted metal-dependent RNase
MKVKFYGAAEEVGRSCILIESNNTKILLDCGVKLGHEERKEEYPLITDAELRTVDAIVLSHTHLDHSGYIPHVLSTAWNGMIYATKPTMEIVSMLLKDYIRISMPKNVSKDALGKLKKHYRSIEYGREFKVKGLAIKLYSAGNILGSSLVEVSDGKNRLLYTGDLSLRKTKLLDPAHTENLNCDTLIIETTHGGVEQEFVVRQQPIKDLPISIKQTIDKGGKIVIPALAIGRGQEVLLMLDDYMRSGFLPKVPIYVDGMIGKAMLIHRNNLAFCRPELQDRIKRSKSKDDPFMSSNFHNVTTEDMRKKVIKEHGPSIIVTTSGMLNGGPVLKYLERLGGDRNNKMTFVCYQVEGTLGRKILEGSKEIDIRGRKTRLNLSIERFRMSGHADKDQLVEFIGKVKGLKTVFLIHGERGAEKEIRSRLGNRYRVEIPVLNQEFDIQGQNIQSRIMQAPPVQVQNQRPRPAGNAGQNQQHGQQQHRHQRHQHHQHNKAQQPQQHQQSSGPKPQRPNLFWH